MLENAVFSLNDEEVFIEYLMNLGERHKAWPVRLEHFDVCILLCRSRLLRGTYCCIALYCDVNYSSRKCSANKGYIFNNWFSATPRATLTHLSCSPNLPRASYLDERTADV